MKSKCKKYVNRKTGRLDDYRRAEMLLADPYTVTYNGGVAYDLGSAFADAMGVYDDDKS